MKFFTRLSLILLTLQLSIGSACAQVQYIHVDSTFGTDGVAFSYDSIYTSGSTCMDVQPDGKTVVAMLGNYLAIARYNADGSVDATFGGNGFTELNTFGYSNKIYTIKVLTDGKILACGEAGSGQTTNFIVRLTAQGAIDSTFGTNGYAVMNQLHLILPDIKVLSDGSIRYIYYHTDLPSSALTPHIQKLSTNGTIDNTFGTINISRLVCGGVLATFNLDHNDRLMVAGRDSLNIFVAGAILPDGTPDPTFGTGGFTHISTAGSNAVTLNTVTMLGSVITPDNSIIAILKYATTSGDISAVRIRSSGVQDNSYGQGGVAATTFNVFSGPLLSGLLALDNGDVIISTQTNFNTGSSFLNEGHLQVLNPSGQLVRVFSGQTDSLIEQFDTVDVSGSWITYSGALVHVPGQNQFMTLGATRSTSHPYLARYAYTGFVAGIADVSGIVDMALYPNPSSTQCTITTSGESDKYTARLLDIAGKEIIQSWTFAGMANTFSVASYAKGVYLLQISDSKGGQAIRKLVIE